MIQRCTEFFLIKNNTKINLSKKMLYDLNRNEAVVLTFLPGPKWVNDYAVAKVITELKNRIKELEAHN